MPGPVQRGRERDLNLAGLLRAFHHRPLAAARILLWVISLGLQKLGGLGMAEKGLSMGKARDLGLGCGAFGVRCIFRI